MGAQVPAATPLAPPLLQTHLLISLHKHTLRYIYLSVCPYLEVFHMLLCNPFFFFFNTASLLLRGVGGVCGALGHVRSYEVMT